MKKTTYWHTIGTIIFDENNRLPLWVVDDLVINPDNLKVESYIVKDSFFKDPKIISTSSIPDWWKDIYTSSYSIKEIDKSIVSKKILEKEIWIIWNSVENEQWKSIWTVVDLQYSKTTYQWLSIIIKQSFFWLFFYWKELEINRENIIDVKKDKIIIKDLALAKAT